MMFKVKVRATGHERLVTASAYAAKGPKVYEKLGTVNDDGSEIAASPNRSTPQAQGSVRGAAPVVVRQIEVPQITTQVDHDKDAKDVQQQTDTEILKAVVGQAPKEKKKPGPKPRKESISSNSDANGK
jgi:hypothetical protein